MPNCINKFRQILSLLLYSCICLDRFRKNSIFRIRSNMTYYITQAMLGHVCHSSNDINKQIKQAMPPMTENKFYRNFFCLKFKVHLQDIEYFCLKQIRVRQLTNVNVYEIPLRRGQFHCDHQKLNLLTKTLQNNNTLHLCLFFKRKLRFSLLSFIFFSFKSLCQNCSLLKVHNHALT